MNGIKVDIECTQIQTHGFCPHTVIKRKDNQSYMSMDFDTIQYYPIKVHHPDKPDVCYFVKHNDREIFNDLLMISDSDILKLETAAYKRGKEMSRIIYRYKISWIRRMYIGFWNFLGEYQCPECLSRHIKTSFYSDRTSSHVCVNCKYILD